MYIPILSLEITLILLRDRQSVFRDFSERALLYSKDIKSKDIKMSKDIKNILEITFLDDGVSVLYMLCVVYCFFPFFILFVFLFLVGVGRPSGGMQSQH